MDIRKNQARRHSQRIARVVQRAASGALALAGALAVMPSHANLALAKKHNCLACHAVASKMVGPSYQEVAAKYADKNADKNADDKNAVAALVKSIGEGGSGKWGDVPMPPQAQLSAADAKRLAQWIAAGAK